VLPVGSSEDDVAEREGEGNSDTMEGEVKCTPRRSEWARPHLGPEAARLLKEDEAYFLRQALSAPCLNVLSGCEGLYLQDLQGRRYTDFHGNSVHQVGFGNPRVIQTIKAQLDALPFCGDRTRGPRTARYLGASPKAPTSGEQSRLGMPGSHPGHRPSRGTAFGMCSEARDTQGAQG
jgi:hypothetical protein